MAYIDKDAFDLPFTGTDYNDPGFDDDFDSADTAQPIVIEAPGTRTFPHPVTGKMHTSTRASQWAKAVTDDFTLNRWKSAMVALGMGLREDLQALSASTPIPAVPVELRDTGWWMPWADIAEMAMDAASYRSGAHKGTAIHSWGQQLDEGTIELDDVPARWRGHLGHYQRVRTEHGLSVHPSYIETGVFTDKLGPRGVNGRLDNVYTTSNGGLIVGDLKTGTNAPEGLDEITVQLAIYANAEWHVDFTTGVSVPAPRGVNKDVAVVVHVPVHDPASADVIPIDIAWGWQAAQVASWMLRYRNRARRKNCGLRLHPDIMKGL